jgi:hypothetical protein
MLTSSTKKLDGRLPTVMPLMLSHNCCPAHACAPSKAALSVVQTFFVLKLLNGNCGRDFIADIILQHHFKVIVHHGFGLLCRQVTLERQRDAIGGVRYDERLQHFLIEISLNGFGC